MRMYVTVSLKGIICYVYRVYRVRPQRTPRRLNLKKAYVVSTLTELDSFVQNHRFCNKVLILLQPSRRFDDFIVVVLLLVICVLETFSTIAGTYDFRCIDRDKNWSR